MAEKQFHCLEIRSSSRIANFENVKNEEQLNIKRSTPNMDTTEFGFERQGVGLGKSSKPIQVPNGPEFSTVKDSLTIRVRDIILVTIQLRSNAPNSRSII